MFGGGGEGGIGREGVGENTLSSAGCISRYSFGAYMGDACGAHSGTRSVRHSCEQQSGAAGL